MNERFDTLDELAIVLALDPLDDAALDDDDAVTLAPATLRTSVLEAARARRPAGEATGTDQGDMTPAQAYAASVANLDAVLASLSDDEWFRPTGLEYGQVKDLVAHLIGVEELMIGWLGQTAGPVLDHVAGTWTVIDELRRTAPSQLLARWRSVSQAVVELAPTVPSNQPLQLFDLPATVEGTMVIRTFEEWTHTDDVLRAVGRAPGGLDSTRARMMSAYLVAALPVALALSDPAPTDVSVRFVLTGPGGGTYDQVFGAPADPTPSTFVVTDVVSLCRFAANRLHRCELVTDIDGNAAFAERVLAVAGAFARD